VKAPEEAHVASRNPWWIPPVPFGRVPGTVPEAHIRLLGAVALAALFENFDQAMLTQAIKQIAADFGIAEQALGSLLGWVRLGAVPALLLIPFADRLGRRRLFLASTLGMSLATVASAFAPSAVAFIAFQMLGRTFMVTLAATAYVIVSEEMAAEHRGWSIGILGALGTFGVGLSALMFAVIEVLPYGWRAMYVVGVVPLLLMPMFRRRIDETRRFVAHRAERAESMAAPGAASGAESAGWWRPLRSLFRHYPGRTLCVSLIGASVAGSAGAAYNFSAYFVQEVHGWAPGQYSLMLLSAGVVGVVGHPFAGRMADRRGRRLVGFLFFASFPLLTTLFYVGPAWTVPLAWIPLVFALTGASTIVRALTTELFPTSYRGTASGWLQLLETLGAAGALFAVSWLTAEGASTIPAVREVAFVSWLAALAVFFLPETGRRELEEISAER
jgi:MFS family permease